MARARKTRLTDAGIARLKPATREYTIWDTRMPNLEVRVRPSGHRGYVYQCTVDGRAKRVTLGPAALKTVAEVRRECLEIAVTRKSSDRSTSARGKTPTFAAFVAGPWKSACLDRFKPATQKSVRGSLRTQLLPAFGDLPLDRIDRLLDPHPGVARSVGRPRVSVQCADRPGETSSLLSAPTTAVCVLELRRKLVQLVGRSGRQSVAGDDALCDRLGRLLRKLYQIRNVLVTVQTCVAELGDRILDIANSYFLVLSEIVEVHLQVLHATFRTAPCAGEQPSLTSDCGFEPGRPIAVLFNRFRSEHARVHALVLPEKSAGVLLHGGVRARQHRNVPVALRACSAARTGAEQHDRFDPRAGLDGLDRRAAKKLVVGRLHGRSPVLASPARPAYRFQSSAGLNSTPSASTPCPGTKLTSIRIPSGSSQRT